MQMKTDGILRRLKLRRECLTHALMDRLRFEEHALLALSSGLGWNFAAPVVLRKTSLATHRLEQLVQYGSLTRGGSLAT